MSASITLESSPWQVTRVIVTLMRVAVKVMVVLLLVLAGIVAVVRGSDSHGAVRLLIV